MLMTCALSITLEGIAAQAGRVAALHVEGHHGAAQARLLPHRQRVLRMRFQPG
jgi:hypothetical protein